MPQKPIKPIKFTSSRVNKGLFSLHVIEELRFRGILYAAKLMILLITDNFVIFGSSACCVIIVQPHFCLQSLSQIKELGIGGLGIRGGAAQIHRRQVLIDKNGVRDAGCGKVVDIRIMKSASFMCCLRQAGSTSIFTVESAGLPCAEGIGD